VFSAPQSQLALTGSDTEEYAGFSLLAVLSAVDIIIPGQVSANQSVYLSVSLLGIVCGGGDDMCGPGCRQPPTPA